MHAYLAHSLIYTVEDKPIEIDEIRTKFKEIIKDTKEELKSDDFYIETILNPIIHYFKDIQKRNCLSFNFGYRLWCSDNTSESGTIEYQMEVNKKIVFLNGTLMMKYFNNNCSFVAFGVCNDHSYVQDFKPMKRTIVIGPKPHNLYIWYNTRPIVKEIAGTKYIVYESEQIEDELIYTIFPKKYITLPSKEIIDGLEEIDI